MVVAVVVIATSAIVGVAVVDMLVVDMLALALTMSCGICNGGGEVTRCC